MAAGDESVDKIHPLQFGLKELLLWMAGTALVFAAARWVVPSVLPRPNFRGPGWEHMISVFVLLVGYHTVLPLSILAAVFARRYSGYGVVLVLGGAAIGSWLEPQLFNLMLGMQNHEDDHVFYLLNGAHVSWLLGNLLFLRLCGYRMSAAAA